jgi:tetratricopeptide (TPR) repeat protein
VAYAGLPFRRRRELHLRIAEALVPRGEPDGARLGLLALHFDGSGNHAMAWKYNRMAGERARESYATLEATAFLERAINNARAGDADVVPAELADAYEALADVALLSGRFDLAKDGLRSARRLRGSEPLAFARLCRKEGKLRERLGKHGAALPWFRKGLTALARQPDDVDTEVSAERARLLTELGSTLLWRQKYRQAVRWATKALPHALASGDRRAEAHVYRVLEWAFMELHDDRAYEYRTLAQPIYEELGDFIGLGVLLVNGGVSGLLAGRWSQAADDFSQARIAFQRAGDLVNVAQAAANLAEIYVEQGHYEAAEPLLREARRVWRSSGFAMGVAAVNNCLGRGLGRSGRAAEGVELLRDAKERFEQLGHPPYVAESSARLAEVHLFAGAWDAALAELDQLNWAAAEETGPQVVALAMRVRGAVLARLGELDSAREWLQRCRETGEKQGVEWEAALAAIELARLPGVPAEEADLLHRNAAVVLTSMGVDIERALPPR